MFRIILFLSILISIPLNTFGGGAKPAPPPLSISVSTKDVFYVNQKIKFSAAGGTTPYTFSANIGTINKSTGDYTAPSSSGQASVKVTDAKKNTATYNVPVYFYLGITPTSSSVPTSGNFYFTGTGGLTPYKFSTTGGTIVSSNGTLTTPSAPGNLVVTVTDSRNNKASSNVTVYQALGISPISRNMIAGASFTFTRIGGMGPTFTFSTNAGSINASTGGYTAAASGTADVAVTDSRGAKAIAKVTIFPKLAINPKTFVMVVNGSKTFTATGGIPPLTFSTTRGTIGPSNGIFMAPGTAGPSVVTVTDSQGNTDSSNVTINNVLAINPPSINIPINSSSNFTGSGGVPGYLFFTTFGSINSTTGVFNSPGSGGSSIVTLRDSVGTEKTSSVCVFAPLRISPVDKILAVGKTQTYSGSEGCKPYRFSTNIGTIDQNTGLFTAPPNSGSGKITIVDAANNSTSTNVVINTTLALEKPPLTLPINGNYTLRPIGGVPPFIFWTDYGSIDPNGNYKAPNKEGTANVKVTDGDGVERTGQICVYEPLEISPAEKSIILGDALSFQATHGCRPYVFTTDKGSINPDSGSYTAPLVGPGLGTVTVTDLANKSARASLTIYDHLSLSPKIGKLQVKKTLKLTALDGIPAHTWSASVGSISPSSVGINPLSVESITNVSSTGTFTAPDTVGTAIITVTDKGNHNQTAEIEIYAPLEITPDNKTLAVEDKFDFKAKGGVPPYFFETLLGGSIITNGDVGSFTAPSNPIINGKIKVKDSALPPNEAIANVSVNSALVINPTFAYLGVNNDLKFQVSGGVGNYTFLATSGKDIDLSGNYRPIKSGEFFITAKDEGGHSVEAKVIVYNPLELDPKEIELAVGDSFDRFKAKEGVPGYSYSMDIGFVDPVTGFYTAPLGNDGIGYVTVTDKLFKTAQARVTIRPALSLTSDSEFVEAGKGLKFSALGGVGAYTFSTSNGLGQIDPSGNYTALANAGPGYDTITVTDSGNPRHSKSKTIFVYRPLAISPAQGVILVLNDNFQFLITGGVTPYKSVTTLPGKGRVDSLGYYTSLVVGDDEVTVVDQIGNTVTAKLTVNALLTLDPRLGNLKVNTSLGFRATGGIPNYIFSALPPYEGNINQNGNFLPLISGSAKITVRDQRPFTTPVTDLQIANINVYNPPKISPVNNITEIAEGNTLDFIIEEGVPAYKDPSASLGSFVLSGVMGTYTAPSSGISASSVAVTVKVFDQENNEAFTHITVHPKLKIEPTEATLAVNRSVIFKGRYGVPPYKFEIRENPADGSKGVIGLLMGEYTAPSAARNDSVLVVVKDARGNEATAIVTINEDLIINPKEIKLASNKTANFTASGGVGELSFSAINGIIDRLTGAYTPKTLGKDTIRVTDIAGFFKEAEVTVYDPLKISPTQKDLAVNDPFTFSLSGGFLPFTVVKADRGQFTSNGNYIAPAEVGDDAKDTITVTDSDNNTVTAEINIKSALSITPAVADLEVKTILPFVASGGVGKYTFLSTSGKDITLDGKYSSLRSGQFTITVRDEAGHSAEAKVNVYDPLKISPTSKVLAFGNQLTFTGSGGVPPYEYLFEGGVKKGEIVTDGVLGRYTAPSDEPGVAHVILKDKINNQVKATVNINTSLAAKGPDSLPIGDNLNFANIVSGGVPGYSYSSPKLGSIDANGNYRAPTEGEGGTETITITDSAEPSASVSVSFCVYAPLEISFNKNAIALGDTSTFEAKKGCKPYKSFEVTKGSSVVPPNSSSGSFTASNTGQASVKVIDAIEKSADAFITVNPSLAINPDSEKVVVKGTKKFVGSGGVGDLLFSVSRGLIDSQGNYTAPDVVGDGEAIVTLKDSADPVHTVTASVKIYNPLEINPNQKILAVGDTIDFVITGGFLPYLSILSNSNGTIDENRKYKAFVIGDGLVTVTDSDNNSVEAKLTIRPALSINPDLAKVVIKGTKKFIGAGGVGDLHFSAARGTIDSQGNYIAPDDLGDDTITLIDSANPVHTVTASVKIYNPLDINPKTIELALGNEYKFEITGGFPLLTVKAVEGRGFIDADGNYKAPAQKGDGKDTVTVLDSDGNEVTASVTIRPELKINPTQATMAVNRTKQFQGIDGVPPYRYEIKDNPVDGSKGVIGITGSFTAPGNSRPEPIIIVVKDVRNNEAIASVTINPELKLDPGYKNLAINQEVKFNASGGVGDLTFNPPLFGTINPDGNYKASADKGLVYITVKDSEGITATSTVNVYRPLAIDPTEKILAVGKQFNFSAIEGVPPYLFSLDGSIGSIITNVALGPFTAGGQTLPVVGYVVLRDKADPDNEVRAQVTVNPPLSIDPSPKHLAINRTYDFGASTKGGTPPFIYSVVSGAGGFGLNGIFTASGSGGMVTIKVADNMDGEATATFCVYAPLEIEPGTLELAQGNSFTFKGKEGCKPYRFNANFGSIDLNSGLFTAGAPGSGEVTITDDANQSISANITIHPPLSLNPSVANVEVGKSFDFTASDGVPPYEFSLFTPSGMGSINPGAEVVKYTAPGLNGGSNRIIVQDNFGNKKEATVNVYESLKISPSEMQNIEAGKQAISFTASGGVPPYLFSLNPVLGGISSNEAIASYTPPEATKGVTKVILIDKENNNKEVEINVYLPLILSPSANQTIGKNDKITFTASEGLPGYTWTVAPLSASLVVSEEKTTAEFSAPNITELTNYTVTVMDSGGTSRTANVAVSLPLIISPKTLSIAVKGSSSFSASGGYEPYKFTTNIGAIDQFSGSFNALNVSGSGIVTVTDAANLTDTANVTIIPGLTIMPTQASVGVNGSYNFILTGGIPPYRSGADVGSTSDHTGGFTYMATGAAGEAVVNAVDSSTPTNQVFASVKIYAGLGIDPPFRTLGLNETATFKGTAGLPNYVFSAKEGSIETDPAGDGGKGVGNYVFSKMVLMDTVTVRDNAGATAQAFVNGNFPSLFIWAYGSDAFNFPGGQGANAGFPGSRAICANWSDSNGNLWFFGGLGLSPSSARIVLYYFSRYDTKDNTWHTYEATARNAGKYGTKGVADISNFAGARYGAVTWTTDGGKTLWLFGGHGYADANNALGELNDLWKIDVTKPEANLPRTWVSGSDKINQQGNYGSGVACPSTLAGGAPPSPTSVPGARSKAVSWLDPQGNFWLFGGKGYDCAGTLGYLNDLWKFTVSTKQWTWIGGSNKVNSPGQFTNGTDGTYATPGAREGAVSWVDVNGDFWLFGGSSSATTFLNGLWKYNRTTNRWAFVKGSTVANQLGVYGNKAEGYPLNNPGSRDGAISFADSKGNLFLFGGYGYAESGGIGFLNDYWRFNTLDGSNNWIWEGGDKTINGLGSHGEIGVASPNSWPGARSYPAFWKDSNGKFWFFGGSRTRNIEDAPTGDFYNDMWKFFPK